jgi:hypothetical protein
LGGIASFELAQVGKERAGVHHPLGAVRFVGQPKEDVLPHGLGKDPRGLASIAEGAPKPQQPAVQLELAQEGVEQAALPTADGPDHADELPGLHFQLQVDQGRLLQAVPAA